MPKRTRVSSKRAVQTSMRVGNWASLARASRARRRPRSTRGYMVQRLSSQVQRINRMIETKTGVWDTGLVTRDLPHNNIYIVVSPGNGLPGNYLNMLQVNQGVQDGMGTGQVSNRIGDKITVKGVLIRAIFENPFNRPKVFYRVMVVKCAKNDVPTRATLFQGNSPNKMIDQVNTERYSIIAQKQFTISISNPRAAEAADGSGQPVETELTGIGNAAIGTKMVSMWIPGNKFGRGGNVTFESNAGIAVKFFDYYIICVAYDWYGTPQDVNNVGKINSLYTKVYFQDA